MASELRLAQLEIRLDLIKCEIAETEARTKELHRIHAEVYETIERLKKVQEPDDDRR